MEWSIWVRNPAQPAVNASRIYTNAMPTIVGTSRPKLEEKEAARVRFPLSPVSVIQFFGDPARDLDVDLKVKQGTFLSHWPASNERGSRLQWFKSDLSKTPPTQIPPSYLPENHWFQKLRDADGALYLKYESHFERFIAYDSELSLAMPVKIRGGPDEYTLQNLTGHRLLDVAVVVPTPDGFRVAWLDELPTAAPEKKKEDAAPAKKSDKEKVDAFFKEGEKKKNDDEPPPLPAEGDSNVKARVDQQLNRPVVVNVEKAPRREVLDLITGQVRLRYELDDRTLAKADINLAQTTSMNAPNIAARDALADLLGNLGLSYRVADDGRLFITTAARLAEEASKKGTVIEGPPVKLTMPPPMKASNPSYVEVTRHARSPGRYGRPGPARRRCPGLVVPIRQEPLRARRADHSGASVAGRDRRCGGPRRVPSSQKTGPNGLARHSRSRPSSPGPSPGARARARRPVAQSARDGRKPPRRNGTSRLACPRRCPYQ